MSVEDDASRIDSGWRSWSSSRRPWGITAHRIRHFRLQSWSPAYCGKRTVLEFSGIDSREAYKIIDVIGAEDDAKVGGCWYCEMRRKSCWLRYNEEKRRSKAGRETCKRRRVDMNRRLAQPGIRANGTALEGRSRWPIE